MHSISAESWIAYVLARAAELRAAGVVSISTEGCSATFLPAPAPPHTPLPKSNNHDESYPSDPLHDPASYPDGVVPGFKIEKFASPEDDH